MEFASREFGQPDDDLLRMFGALGSQIGRLVERGRAEDKLKEQTENLEEARRVEEQTASRLGQFVKDVEITKQLAEDATQARGELCP